MSFTPSLYKHIRFISKEERKAYIRKLNEALENKVPFEYGFNLITKDNIKKYV